MIITDMLLPPLGTTDPYLVMQAPGAWSIGDLSIDLGAGAITAESVGFNIKAEPEGTPMPDSVTLSVSISELLLPESLAEIAGDSPLLLLAGHDYDMHLQVEWTPETGALSVYEALIYSPTLGEIKLIGFLEGLSPETIESIVTLADTPPENQADMVQQLGMKLLSEIRLSLAYLSILDEGMVDAALDLAALNAGTSAEEAKGLYTTLAESVASEIGTSAFAQDLPQATEAFLDNGGTLTFNASPARSVSLLEAFALFSMPNLLIQQLGLGVTHTP